MFSPLPQGDMGALSQALSRRQSGGSDSVGRHPAHSWQPPPATLEVELVLRPRLSVTVLQNLGLGTQRTCLRLRS